MPPGARGRASLGGPAPRRRLRSAVARRQRAARRAAMRATESLTPTAARSSSAATACVALRAIWRRGSGNELTLVGPAGSSRCARRCPPRPSERRSRRAGLSRRSAAVLASDQRDRYRLEVAGRDRRVRRRLDGQPARRDRRRVRGARSGRHTGPALCSSHPSFPQSVNVGFMQRAERAAHALARVRARRRRNARVRNGRGGGRRGRPALGMSSAKKSRSSCRAACSK